MDNVISIIFDIALLALLALIYYLYQKRKIGYYVAKEIELLNLKLLEIVNAHIANIEISSQDSQRLSDSCLLLEKGIIDLESLLFIKNIFHDNADIESVSNHLIDIIEDRPWSKELSK